MYYLAYGNLHHCSSCDCKIVSNFRILLRSTASTLKRNLNLPNFPKKDLRPDKMQRPSTLITSARGIQEKCKCSELRCIWQYSGSFGLFYWTLVSFRRNLVPINGTSQRDYKLVPSRVHDCQCPIYTAVVLIYYSVAFHISLFAYITPISTTF